MNQILSTEVPKRRKKPSTVEIGKIVKFFAIGLIIYGVFVIGSASYSMYKESQKPVSVAKPVISISSISETEILLEVTHNKELSKVTYTWNDNEPVEIECNGIKRIEQKIEMPSEDSTINVSAIDVNGLEGNLKRQYTKPRNVNIDMQVEGNNIKVKGDSTEQLSYLTYRWDDQEETRLEINDKQFEQEVPVPVGLHTLTVTVVDVNNNAETKEQEVKGVSKPKVEVTTNGSDKFLIKASDEEGIKKVEFIINETDKNRINLDQVRPIEERKEFEYEYPLHDGENKLEVRVYNESDVSEVFKALVRK